VISIFEDVVKKEKLVKSVDDINQRWGEFVIASAKTFMGEKSWMPDRIAFGGVKELEEFTLLH